MQDEGASSSSGSGDAGAQWPVRVVDTIDEVVTAFHDRVIRPLIVASRAVVFGIIVAVMALILSILLGVALVRLLDVYAFRGRAWVTDVVVGGLLAVAGLFLWTKRRARGDASPS